MKLPAFLLIVTIMTMTISGCQSQPIPVQSPAMVSLKSCASSKGPLPSLSNLELPPAKRLVKSSIGGGLVQSNEFSIEVLLYCDSVFQPDATETDYRSDIGGLAIYFNWRFDAPIQNEKTFSYFGMEPHIQLRLVSYTQGYVAQGQSTGIQFTSTLPDFSKKSSQRFVYIAQGPFGQMAGAVLSFDLQQVSDGLQPSNIFVASLSNVELQSIKSGLPTVTP